MFIILDLYNNSLDDLDLMHMYLKYASDLIYFSFIEFLGAENVEKMSLIIIIG